MKGIARFSPDRHYRYILGRFWEPQETAPITWVMINPSTATAKKNDPTIRRCIFYSQREGAGGLYVVNLFAQRTSNPRELKNWPDPIGPGNDQWIRWAVRRASRVIVAWGARAGNWPGRVEEVVNIIESEHSLGAWCLGRCSNGQPRHPLMLSHKVELELF